MVVRSSLIEPLSAVADEAVRPVTRRMVQRSFRHQNLLPDGDRLAIGRRAATDASLGVLAYDRVGRIGIKEDRSVEGLAPHIAHGKHEVSRDPTFDRQAPLLAGGCAQDWIETGRSIDRAGLRYRWAAGAEKRGVLVNRNEREQRTTQLLARTKRWIGIGPVPEDILEIVMDSKSGPHRPGSPTGWVPGDAHARLQQQFGMVLFQAGMTHDRF